MKYIVNFYEAAKTYLQSRGIAWFDLEAVNRVIKFLGEVGDFTTSTQLDEAGILSGIKFPTGREAGYILKFLWYLGLVKAKYH